MVHLSTLAPWAKGMPRGFAQVAVGDDGWVAQGMDQQEKTAGLWYLQQQGQQWTLVLQGDWSPALWQGQGERPPSAATLLAACPDSLAQLHLNLESLEGWSDTLLPALVYGVGEGLQARGASLEIDTQDHSLQALLKLAQPVTVDAKAGPEPSRLERLGLLAMGWETTIRAAAVSTQAFGGGLLRLATGRASMRGQDLLEAMYRSGTQALPIITLVSLLVGSILAFVGALQLRTFGAEIYIAEMVGIAVAREMAAMMTAIVMAGRTGAAFAAHLATMQVNEEVDALKTLGVPPSDFLALPRVLGLTLMMPLLFLYSAVISIAGGLLVALFALGLEPMIFVQRIIDGVALHHFAIGLFKSVCFGVLIGVVSCHMGLAAGRSAAAVGQAATRAVVVSIVGIILVDSLFAIVSTYSGF
ncbi:MAG: ABC transporter permease [Halomonadaceae bacterium]|nr:MAG: ABC transporter permease [Halomonadaceae bacterium]